MDIESISERLSQIVKIECDKLIDQIANEYNLNRKELSDKYLSNNNFSYEKKKRTRKSVPADQMCLGRKIDFTQCTRRRKGDKCFCATHANSLPFGRIDDGKEYPDSLKDVKKNDDYIAMRVYEYEDNKYLIDNNNIIYTFNVDNPVRIGIKNDDGEVVKITIEEYEGTEYMIDTNNRVYSIDVDNPKLLGLKNEDNNIVFNNSE